MDRKKTKLNKRKLKMNVLNASTYVNFVDRGNIWLAFVDEKSKRRFNFLYRRESSIDLRYRALRTLIHQNSRLLKRAK